MHRAAQRVDNREQRQLDREQELITVIQEETKRTEEKKQAGFRSPTWSILRALQNINKAKRLESESIMSAPLFFQSAGRGDLKFWGEDDGPIVTVWESLSKSEQEQWSKKIGKSKDWGVWCRSRKKTKSNARLKLTKKKSSQTAESKQKLTQEKGWIRKKAKGSQCRGARKRGGDRATSNAQ